MRPGKHADEALLRHMQEGIERMLLRVTGPWLGAIGIVGPQGCRSCVRLGLWSRISAWAGVQRWLPSSWFA